MLYDMRAEKQIGFDFYTGKFADYRMTADEYAQMIVSKYKMNLAKPLIVEIPDRHGSGNISESINKYISEAIGVKL